VDYNNQMSSRMVTLSFVAPAGLAGRSHGSSLVSLTGQKLAGYLAERLIGLVDPVERSARVACLLVEHLVFINGSWASDDAPFIVERASPSQSSNRPASRPWPRSASKPRTNFSPQSRRPDWQRGQSRRSK
jgi:hypothetical protein